MTNNIKKIIACTLTISAISATPFIDCNDQFASSVVYADTTEDKNSVLLDGISLSEGEIDFSPDVKSYTIKVKKNIDDIEIKVSPKGSSKKINVSIDGNMVDEDDDYKYNVDLEKGDNVIKIKIRNKNNPDKEEIYTLNIRRSTNVEDQSDVPDDIYLEYLNVGTEEIELDKDKLEYIVNVNESLEEIKIKAEPEHDSYEVKINGDEVTQGEKYRKTISLDKGKNIVKIKLKDDDDVRIYTIIINRGKVESSDSTLKEDEKIPDTNNNVNKENIKANQWVQVNGNWQYNDAAGNPIKNAWFLDKTTSKYYYLQEDGFRATGWLKNNDKWYLLNNNGEMQVGWKYDNGAWYFLDAISGEMKTGWIQGSKGEWYYLTQNGSMKTGWLKNNIGDYYYFNSDGKMKTGWLNENNKWYYLNSDGRMETSSVTVNGVTYYFKENGELK